MTLLDTRLPEGAAHAPHAAAGLGGLAASTPAATVYPHSHSIDVHLRASLKGHRPAVLWLTGLSGAGKSTLANRLERRLHQQGLHTYLLDGDNVRHGLNRDLGFSEEDRVENIRRVAQVARLMADAGLIVITALISPYRADRAMARSLMQEIDFVEIHVDTPLAVAEARDPKGLYRKARRGEIAHFTGVSAPYEAPIDPELRLDAGRDDPDALADQVWCHLSRRGLWDEGDPARPARVALPLATAGSNRLA